MYNSGNALVGLGCGCGPFSGLFLMYLVIPGLPVCGMLCD